MMKRQLCTLVLAAFVSAMGLTGCSKKADAPAGPGGTGGGSTKDKLVGSYKIVQIELQDALGTTDVLESFSSCEKDNIFVLKADMTSAVVDAGEKCNPSSDDTGTWEVKDKNTVSLNGQDFKIITMDGKNLKMTSTYIEDGVTQTLNVGYVKQ